jgi:hypothetical protein
MKENNFKAKKIGEIDISDWLVMLNDANMNVLYDKYPFRQQQFVHHVSTKTLPLLWTSNYTHFRERVIIQYKFEEFNMFKDKLDKLIEMLNEIYPDCIPVKIMLAKLLGKSEVLTHIDVSRILQISHRIHVPMITSEHVIFTIDNEPYQMKAGEVYEVNNVRPHNVVNNGENDRTHLIIDMMPRSYIKKTATIQDIIITETNKDEFKI